MKTKVIGGLTTCLAAALFMPSAALAASTVVVTPSNTQGWTTSGPLADNRPGGSVNYIYDSTSPAPNGALQLLTDTTTTAKAQYMHPTNTQLANVTELSYYTKEVTPNDNTADPSYQLAMCLNGVSGTTCNGFTTLVYEPYQGGQGTVQNNQWQQWNIGTTGLLWSTRPVVCSNGTITGSPGGPATYTIAAVQSACPSAVVVGYGVNVGSNNPGYNVETDLFNFNGTVYDFQLTNAPTDKDQCKNGGYVNYTDENGNGFKNQGQCVAYTNRGSKVLHYTTNTVNIKNNNNQSASTGNANSINNTTGGNATSGNANNTNSNTNNVNVSNNPTF